VVVVVVGNGIGIRDFPQYFSTSAKSENLEAGGGGVIGSLVPAAGEGRWKIGRKDVISGRKVGIVGWKSNGGGRGGYCDSLGISLDGVVSDCVNVGRF